jgi:hypothetical protein
VATRLARTPVADSNDRLVTAVLRSSGREKESGARLSPLELFHPDGEAGGVAVLGRACPPALIPRGGTDAKQLDLVIIAPTGEELRQKGWLEGLLDGVVPKLAVDGIVYLLASPFTRAKVLRRLSRRGLHAEVAVAHVPDLLTSRYLVPLDREPAAMAFAEVVPVWPRRRGLLSRVLRVPGAARLLGRLLPSVAVIVRREAARPLFDWLSQLTDDRDARLGVVVSGAPPEYRLVVLSGEAGAKQAPIVAKVGEAASSRLDREATILLEVAPSARLAGVDVPKPRFVRRLSGRSVLLEDRLAGEVAAALLASRPHAFSSVVRSVADWLVVWHRSTAVLRTLEPAELRRYVLEPAEKLAGELPNGEDYVWWLSERARDVAAAPVPLVNAHNDLTMFNVLVGRKGLGVVDWESAAVDRFPLTDFAYAAVDAASAAARYEDRAAAFEDCFSSDGRHVRLVGQLLRSLATAVGAAENVAELSFHACWLHHAANEQRNAATDVERPFVAILRRIADRRDEWPGLFRE